MDLHANAPFGPKGRLTVVKRLKSRLPAKRVPDAIERWLRMYDAEREEGENFEAYAERVGNERFEAEVVAGDRVAEPLGAWDPTDFDPTPSGSKSVG